MKIGNFFNKYLSLIFALLFLSVSFLIGRDHEKPFVFITKQESSLNVNDEFISRFNLGLKRLISSTLWVSTILESDIDHYKQKDLNSWMFLRFYSISKLEPMFYENYAFGGPYLSIIKDDISGASIIYKKGLSLFPDDYNLLKNAGFHFYFEALDYKEAFPIYKKLKTFPQASANIVNTLSRMEASEGNLEDAFTLLTDLQKKYDLSGLIGQKIYQQRYAIKSELDLTCLNQTKINCNTLDLDGNLYLRRGDFYQAAKDWTPYRIKKKRTPTR